MKKRRSWGGREERNLEWRHIVSKRERGWVNEIVILSLLFTLCCGCLVGRCYVYCNCCGCSGYYSFCCCSHTFSNHSRLNQTDREERRRLNEELTQSEYIVSDDQLSQQRRELMVYLWYCQQITIFQEQRRQAEEERRQMLEAENKKLERQQVIIFSCHTSCFVLLW